MSTLSASVRSGELALRRILEQLQHMGAIQVLVSQMDVSEERVRAPFLRRQLLISRQLADFYCS